MPPPTQSTAAALVWHLVRPRRIAGSTHRPVLATATTASTGPAESLVSFRRAPSATATTTGAAAAAVVCRRPIFSLAAAALGLNKPSSTSSSLSPTSSSPSSSSGKSNTATTTTTTTATTSQAPNGGSYNTIITVRTLPYEVPDLFRIIADVDAYASFLPHCTASRVTQWRKLPSSSSTSWPARADLTVGWGPLSQAYSSRVYCVPGHGVVEAVSGRAGIPTLTAAERAELGLAEAEEPAGPVEQAGRGGGDDDPFESLVTRWEIVPAKTTTEPSGPPSQTALTRVELRIRFQFRNPLYQLAAAQVGSEMATTMIEAFENRAAALLGPPLKITR